MNALKYRATLVAGFIASIILWAAFRTDLDLVRLGLPLIRNNKVDDVLVALSLVIFGLLIDGAMSARRQDLAIQDHRLKVLKATMFTVHDIVNNFLHNLQVFRLEAEVTLSAESVVLFDQLIRQTSEKLKAIAALDTTPEKQMAGGMGIDYMTKGIPTNTVGPPLRNKRPARFDLGALAWKCRQRSTIHLCERYV
jgi:hypothetical protein